MENEQTFSREDTWAHLGNVLAMAFALFGGVAQIASLLILPRKMRVEMLQWLAPLEALARRLLLVEALERPAPNAPLPFSARASLASSYADRPAPALPENPDDWRVRFNVGLGAASAPRAYVQKRSDGAIACTALPLARRFEALRRLIDDRERYVARLAARARHAPERTRRAFAPYRHAGRAVAPVLADTQRDVERALETLNSS